MLVLLLRYTFLFYTFIHFILNIFFRNTVLLAGLSLTPTKF